MTMFAAVRIAKRNLSWRLISVVFSVMWLVLKEGSGAFCRCWHLGDADGGVLNQNYLQNSSDGEYLKSPKLNLTNEIAVVQQTHMYRNGTWESNSCWIHPRKYNSNSIHVDMKEAILQNSNLFSLITELIHVTKQNVGEDHVAMTEFSLELIYFLLLYIFGKQLQQICISCTYSLLAEKKNT